MARWAPIAQAAALTAITKDLVQPAADHRGHPITAGGLVEAGGAAGARRQLTREPEPRPEPAGACLM
jgi:hypothetical protein